MNKSSPHTDWQLNSQQIWLALAWRGHLEVQKKWSITNLNLSDKLISFFLCEVQSAAPSCSFFNHVKIVNAAYHAKGIERSRSNQPWLKSHVAHLLTDYSSHLPTAAVLSRDVSVLLLAKIKALWKKELRGLLYFSTCCSKWTKKWCPAA